jgi:uncharacterized PurR-regulated membrane protein YhhQ (DUF165 family)
MRLRLEEDPWLLPTRQADLPSRPVLTDSRLHARRESSFLLLAGLFLASAATLPLLAAGQLVDLSRLFGGAELPLRPLLPAGALAFPLTFIALDLVTESFGRRRASALALVSLLLNLGLLGIARLADSLAAAPAGSEVTPALALIACGFAAHALHVQIFELLRWRTRGRGLALRHLTASLVAQLGGWAIFAGILYADPASGGGSIDLADPRIQLTLTGVAYTLAVLVVATLPLWLVASGLAIYLRIPRHPSTRNDLETSAPGVPAFLSKPRKARSTRASQPFTNSEVDFFTKGEEEAAAERAESAGAAEAGAEAEAG